MDNQVSEIDFETFVKNNPIIETVKPEEPIPAETVEQKKEIIMNLTKPRGEVIIPDKVAIKSSSIHNQGVFAKVDILEGETIEICPLLQLGWRAKYHHDPILKKYMWANIFCNCNDCKTNSPIVYMPLGYGSIYNHSPTSNAKVDIDWNNHTAKFIATKTILAEEEILITNHSGK